jgi:hypothetical protein
MKRTVMTKIAATVLSLTFLSALGIMGGMQTPSPSPSRGLFRRASCPWG